MRAVYVLTMWAQCLSLDTTPIANHLNALYKRSERNSLSPPYPTMPNYTLTYFEARGFAEVLLLLFHSSESSWLSGFSPTLSSLRHSLCRQSNSTRAMGRVQEQCVVFLSWEDYEDTFLNNLFPVTPFEKVPILEIDGKVLPQSFAIARYLAMEFGLFFSLYDWQKSPDFLEWY